MTQPSSNVCLGISEVDSTVVRERIWSSRRMASSKGGIEVSFQAMGSPCRIWLGGPPAKANAAIEEALRWLAEFEARYSRFIPTSLVNRINAAAGKDWVEIDPETERMLALCHEMNFITRGTFDPTALPLVRLWDWKKNPPVIPDDSAIAAAQKLVGWRKVQRAPGKVSLAEAGMSIDLGGMGKEYAVDQVTLLLAQNGIPGVLVDLGADVRVFGPPPQGKPAWHIGLEDPGRPGQCWTGLAINDNAVATSGDYLRHFVANGHRYGHILDVRTGRPVDNGIRAVSVVASSCSLAGMLSTSAFVLGPEEGLRLLDAAPQAAGCIITDSAKIQGQRFHQFTTR